MKFSLKSKKDVEEQRNHMNFEKQYGTLLTGLFTPMSKPKRR